MLVAITDREKSREAFGLLRNTLNNSRGVKCFRRYVGRSRNQKHEVIWHTGEEIWTLLLENPRSEDRNNYFWCAYGLQHPQGYKTLDIDLEINPPHEGRNSRLGGMFVRDANDNIYLCHTGKIHRGKTFFWEQYWGDSLEVDDGSGKSVRVVSLGQINSAKLPSRIARLIHEIKRIKNISAATTSVPDSFTPEFSGQRSNYFLTGTIEATVDHGFVVDELRKAVEIIGHKPFKDQQRDLFVTGPNGRMTTLFEVKTDVSTTSIYQAVGQLMLNGFAQQLRVKKILVVPQKPTKETEQALKKLCIKVLTYDWKENKPVIPSLDGLLP